MGPLLWLANLWPGFMLAWVRGRWEGVMLGGAVAASLQVALTASWACRVESGGLLSWWTAILAWVSVLSLWGVGLWVGRGEMYRPETCQEGTAVPQCDAWLREAQREYLREHWIEAEMLVGKILSRRQEDNEARLLQASIFRRTARHALAQQVLTHLAGQPRAAAWWWEIEAELRHVAAEAAAAELAAGPEREGRLPPEVARRAA